ncbi:MAG: hypothetical protein ABSA53_16055 [Streptosporangiaceae bacterium]|jgi:hypothetical protein
MHWEENANDKSKKLTEKFTKELAEEAERIAGRLNAGGVSAEYVGQAADRIGLRRASGAIGDILLSVGLALGFAALGVVAIVATEPPGVHLQLGLVKPVSIAVGATGAVLASIGITLKVRS